MKISISGVAGAGKSSIAKMLAEKLNYEYYSIGDFMREIAKKRNIHLYELSKIAEQDGSMDKEIDEKQRNLNSKDNFVVDSRLGFYFIPDSYKVFLKVDNGKAAKRIFQDKRKEEKYKTLKETEEFMKKRLESEKLRYKQYYGIDFTDETQFDLVIDTTFKNKGEIIEEIINSILEKA